MVSPQNLTYNNEEINVYLNTFDVILDVAFDGDSGETSSFLNRSAVAAESHDGRYKNTHLYRYDELFSPRFTIVKKDFSDFSQSEVRKVLKYLTQTDKPALLEVSYDKDGEQVTEDRDFCAIGGFTSIEMYKLANNRTVGILATFEAITPHAMSKLETIPITSSGTYKKKITVETDDNHPIYPKVTIVAKNTDAIEFVNTYMGTSNKSIELTNHVAGEQIIVDGANKLITTTTPNRRFGDDFSWKWLELYDGENEITVTGDCTVTIEYRTVIKCGEY